MAVVSSGQLTLTDLNDNKQLILYLNASSKSQIYDPTASSYTPSFTSSPYLTISPELYIAGGNGSNMLPNGATPTANAQVKSITWYEGTQTSTAMTETSGTDATSTAGYKYQLPSGSATSTWKQLTIKSNLSATQIYTCVVVYTDPDTNFDTTIKANVEIQRIQNGAKGNVGTNAITAFLTNSSANVPATNAGVVSVFTGTGTDIYVYDGTTPLTFTTGTAGNGQFSITTSISPASGVTLATPTVGTSPSRAVYGNITAMATSNADIVTVTYTISGKSLTGTVISGSVVQTFVKNKAPLDGTTPSTYWITTDYAVISKAKNTGAITPATVTATGNIQTGTGAISRSTTFKWVVDTSTDGATFTNNVASPTSSATASQATNVANLKAVRFRMYLSSVTPSTTNMLDEQIVWVVSEGNDGSPAYFLNVSAPNGDAIRNSSGSITLQADLYSGTSLASGTITYKWYIQDATATTASGGDNDGGAGWRLMTTSNYATYGITTSASVSTKTITFNQLGVNGVTGWKCVAILSSIAYNSVIVVRDFQDPISVNILGGNIFKNGQGSTTLTAQLIQAGQEIATTGYTFAWSLYKMDGTFDKTLSGTTDTITVNATDVTGTEYIVCDVSK